MEEKRLFQQTAMYVLFNLHIVSDADIRGAPAELPGIRSKHTDIKAALPRALKQTDRLRKHHVSSRYSVMYNGDSYNLVIMAHVQLKEARALGVTTLRP